MRGLQFGPAFEVSILRILITLIPFHSFVHAPLPCLTLPALPLLLALFLNLFSARSKLPGCTEDKTQSETCLPPASHQLHAAACCCCYPLFFIHHLLVSLHPARSSCDHPPMLLPTRSRTGKRQWSSVGTLATTMACLEVIVAIAVAPNSLHPTSTSRLKGAARPSDHILLGNGLPSFSDSRCSERGSSWSSSAPVAKQGHEKRQLSPWSTETLSPAPTQTNLPPSATASTTVVSLPTALPRPPTKPRLLTDFEYNTMWDPDMNTLRLGVLLNLNAGPRERESIMVRKTLSVIRMAVNDVNENKIIPGLNMSIIVRDSQNPSLYSSTGGSAAISGAGQLISAKVCGLTPLFLSTRTKVGRPNRELSHGTFLTTKVSGVNGDIRSDLTRYEALMTSSVQISQCSFASGWVRL